MSTSGDESADELALQAEMLASEENEKNPSPTKKESPKAQPPPPPKEDPPKEESKPASGGGWGGWGWGMVTNTVTSAVTTLNTVVDTSADYLGKQLEEMTQEEKDQPENENEKEQGKEREKGAPEESTESKPKSWWQSDEIAMFKNLASESLTLSKSVMQKSATALEGMAEAGVDAFEAAVLGAHDYAMDVVNEAQVPTAGRTEEEIKELKASTHSSPRKPPPADDATFEDFFEYYQGKHCLEQVESIGSDCTRAVQTFLQGNDTVSEEQKTEIEKIFEDLSQLLNSSQFSSVNPNNELSEKCKAFQTTKVGSAIAATKADAANFANTVNTKDEKGRVKISEQLLQSISQHATKSFSRLAACSIAHLFQLANIIRDKGDITQWEVPPVQETDVDSAYNTHHGLNCTAVRDFVTFVLHEVATVSMVYSGVAVQLAGQVKESMKGLKGKEKKELDALHSKTRATKGEMYVLQGKATSLLMEGLDKMVAVAESWILVNSVQQNGQTDKAQENASPAADDGDESDDEPVLVSKPEED